MQWWQRMAGVMLKMELKILSLRRASTGDISAETTNRTGLGWALFDEKVRHPSPEPEVHPPTIEGNHHVLLNRKHLRFLA
jgi:hypothetical protein